MWLLINFWLLPIPNFKCGRIALHVHRKLQRKHKNSELWMSYRSFPDSFACHRNDSVQRLTWRRSKWLTGWDDKSRAVTQGGPAGLPHHWAPWDPSREEKEGETDKRGLTSTSARPDAPSSVPLSPFNLGLDRSSGGDAVRLPDPWAGAGHGRVGGYLEGTVAGARVFLFHHLVWKQESSSSSSRPPRWT